MSFRDILLGACVSGALIASAAAAPANHPPAPDTADHAAWHKQMCTDHYAREAGRVAYIEAKLSLTDSQRPLFDSWKQTVLGSAKSRQSECLAHQAEMEKVHESSILDRQAHMKEMLQDRLADLSAEVPSLKALYDSLSPEQKEVFDHGGPMMMGTEMMMDGGHDAFFIHRGMHDGPLHGPQIQGPDGPPPPDDPPPADGSAD